ncbi:Inactive beta-amylase 9 [Morus notabilis]|uniref:Beta-amylase n=1 Tax=Morus notabilis TaxID=981085 RepID=W9RYB3_9ROSA|nr:inactive beta-amylase 9 isoform X2 [Morus notabilis]EXC03129.1 Inactive beta-amylase 9 [Morus notabilis]
MEVSVIGSSQAKVGRTELAYRELGLCSSKAHGVMALNSRANLRLASLSTRWKNAGLRFSPMTVRSQHVRPKEVSGIAGRSKSSDGVRLFVGLPLDVVSDCNTINHARAIAAGLKALKLLGVEGIELPVWWGIVEKEEIGKYEWSGYRAVAEMVENAGLKLHVSLCFHGSKKQKIPLPKWVYRIGESEPSIFFTDRSGQRYKECLSLAVDDLPVLDGKTPVQVYHDFCQSFKSAFMSCLGSTIDGVSMGLGPDGELRYPSHHRASKGSIGVGEFQCYDKNMLSILKQHAEASGNPLWGLGGPHDAPSYDQSPHENNFFKDHGGSWESPYGDLFLSWYSNQLVDHGNRLLSMASSVFEDTGVAIHGKLPLMHSWYGTRSHPSEMTSGFYNTCSRDGYEAVAQMFGSNSCKIILPGMNLSDAHQPRDSLSSPELLLKQIRTACRKHGVEVSGQNSSVKNAPDGFEQIKKNLFGENVINLFTYQRMGEDFFSPKHFSSFMQFVRSLNQPQLHSDDLLSEEEAVETVPVTSESGINMQAA